MYIYNKNSQLQALIQINKSLNEISISHITKQKNNNNETNNIIYPNINEFSPINNNFKCSSHINELININKSIDSIDYNMKSIKKDKINSEVLYQKCKYSQTHYFNF